MTSRQRMLRALLRVTGGAALLAVPCIFLPDTWMNAIHRRLGLGELPGEPIVGYLTRSASVLYAALGGLLWVLASDPGRYAPAIRYMGVVFVVFGVTLLAVDIAQRMPLWWALAEGTINIGLGIAVILLARGVDN